MYCLIDFLSDNYQNRLRLLAQAKSERYEETLNNYKKIFLAHFKNIMVKPCENSKCLYFASCNLIKDKILEIEIYLIENFFDEIQKIYLLWIDAKSTSALKKLESLINKYDILNINENQIGINNIYFKGRLSNEVLTTWDMLHIPFNKRYLINNQRYSLTGQPMVYIGSSVIDIFEELEGSNFSNLKISTVQLPENMKLFDLRNNIFNDLVDLDLELMLELTDISYSEQKFYKLILASICSFKKRQELKGYSFCEEYVLPQMLAQFIKNKKFDGIVYYSTKKFSNVEYIDKSGNTISQDKFDYNLEFKENIALFTNINTDHVYDRKLYDRLTISVPIDINKIEKLSFEDIEEIQKEIRKTNSQQKVAKSDKIISSFKRVYDKMIVDKKTYIDTDMGQLHIYHLFAILHQILVS